MEMNVDTFPAIAHYKGPPLVGFIATSILFGCSLMSLMHYWQFSYATDRRGMKAFVVLLAFWSVITTAFVLATTLRQFAFRFGLRPSPQDPIWNSMNYLLDCSVHILVSGFYARRAWKLHDRALYLAVALTSTLMINAAGAIGAMVTGIYTVDEKRLQLANVFTYIWLGSQLAADTAITALIIVKLLSSRTGWKQTDSLIHKLVVVGIETQLPPAIFTLAFLITYITAPSPAYIGFFVCTPMVYILCVLETLNSRYKLSVRMLSETSGTWKDEIKSHNRSMPACNINITTETYSHSEAAGSIGIAGKRASTHSVARLDDSTDSLPDGQEHAKDMNTSEIRLV